MRLSSFVASVILSVTFSPVFSQNPGDAVFGSSVIHDINIEFTQPDFWDSLLYYKELGDQSNTDYFMKAKVTINGIPVDCVGVRLKGNASYAHPGMKKSIKIQFNEYNPNQEFDELKSFHLNNSAYDPTMLREKLFLDMLNRNNLPAPRCTYARVSYNGSYTGLYKIVESVDKRFLKTRFGDNSGNLYKGDPNGTLQWQGSAQSEYYDDYELKTNETENDWSGLVDLIGRINNSGSSFESGTGSRFNFDTYIRSWAANNVFVNLDSYFHLAHNYYVYDDSLTSKFQWITWDVGIVFGVFPSWFTNKPEETKLTHIPLPSSSRPLNMNILRTDGLKTAYYAAVCHYLYNEFTSEKLFPAIDSLSARIRNDVYAEPSGNRMYSLAEFEGNLEYDGVSAFLLSSDVPGLKDFVGKRRSNIIKQLCKLKYSCYLNRPVGEDESEEVLIYPNPGNGDYIVRFSVPSEGYYTGFIVSNAMGQIVYRTEKNTASGQSEISFNIGHMPDGVYFVKIRGVCEDIVRKLVLIR